MGELGMFNTIDISASGLSAQRVRMNTIANNLANINTTRTPEGGPYKRQEVVFEALFSQEQNSLTRQGDGVKVIDVAEDDSDGVLLYRPEHPDADENGYVAYPNVNPVQEMVDMISASKSFEANVSCITAAREMINSSLNIIK